MCLTYDTFTMQNAVHSLMSQTQLNRYAVISKVIDRHMTIAKTAVSLGLASAK